MSTDQHNELIKKIEELGDKVEAMDYKLNPIYETYTAWLALGRWGKAFLYIAGAVLGLIVAWKNIVK